MSTELRHQDRCEAAERAFQDRLAHERFDEPYIPTEDTMSQTIEAAHAPGLYPQMSAAEYHALPYASNSRLKHLLRSPAHAKAYMESPSATTPALALGSAIHTAVLEPHLFESKYIVAPDCDRRTKEGKAIWEAFQAEANGREIIKQADRDTCLAVYGAIYEHPAAGALLNAAGDVELSVIAEDEASGALYKIRPDKLVGHLGTVVDLKTTQDASREAFTRSIFNLGYHRQAALYLDGLRASGVEVQHFVFVAVEKEPPFGVGVYRLTDEAVEAGRTQLAPLLRTWKWCEDTGEWPGYSEQVEDITLPRYAWGQIEEAA